MDFRSFAIGLMLLTAAQAADTVTLRDGRVITGTYLGGSPREVRIEAGDRIETLDVADVSGIQFDDARHKHEAEVSSTPGDELERLNAGGEIALPEGTRLVIRMIDAVDSEKSALGQTFAASLDEPVVVNGQAVIPRGADVVVKLVDDKESGKLTGRTILTLDLMSIKVNGRIVDVNTETVTQESSSRGSRTAKAVGGTALLGTIIGAIAGGGKGAAIGAGSGAAVGAGAEILTKGQRVRIPSETRLTFVLENTVRL